MTLLSLLLACPGGPNTPPAPTTVTVTTSAAKINSGGTATLTVTAADANGAAPNPGVVVWTITSGAGCGAVPNIASQPGTNAAGTATETFTGAAVTENCVATITVTVSNGGGSASGTVNVTVLPPVVSGAFTTGGVATGDTLTVTPLNASPPTWTYEVASTPTPMAGLNVQSTDPTCTLSSVTQTTPPAAAPAPAPAGALPQTFAFGGTGAVATQVTLNCDGTPTGTTTFMANLTTAGAATAAAAGSR